MSTETKGRTMQKRITLIDCRQSTGVAGRDRHERYYEPVAPRPVLRRLRSLGWQVTTRRVSVEALIARVSARAARASQDSASLAGASSMTHAYGLAAASMTAQIEQIRQAADGRGSLLH